MALIVKDRVKVSSTTTGTGSLTLGSAEDGFQAFSTIADGNTTYYCIKDGSGNNAWEVGIGTISASGGTLARTTILSSSNSNNVITLGSGSHTVFTTYPASKSSFNDQGVTPTFTVSGDTVAAGDPVALNSDGTVTKIAQTTSYNTNMAQLYNSSSTVSGVYGYEYDEANNTVIVLYKNDSSYSTARAGTLNDNTGVITWGTEVVLRSTTIYTQEGVGCLTSGLHSGTLKYYYVQHENSSYTAVWAGWFTVSGTTITNTGTPYQMSSFGSYTSNKHLYCCFDKNQQILVAFYSTYISGTSENFNMGWLQPTGSGYQRWNGGGWGYEQQEAGFRTGLPIVMHWDATASKIVLTRCKNDTQELSLSRVDANSGYGVYSLSYDTDITTGSAYDQVTPMGSVYDANNGRSIICGRDNSSPFYKWIFVCCELSGSGSSWVTTTHETTDLIDTGSTYTGDSWYQSKLNYLAQDGNVYKSYMDSDDSNKWKQCKVTLNTSTGFTAATHEMDAQTLYSTTYPFVSLGVKNGYDVAIYKYTGNPLNAYSGKSETTSNVNDYIGIAVDGAAASSDTLVSIEGSINSNNSGLTINSGVWVTDNGAVGASGTLNIGTAIAGNKVRLHSAKSGLFSLTAGENLDIGSSVGVNSSGEAMKATNSVGTGVDVGDSYQWGVSGSPIYASGSRGGLTYAGNNTWVQTYQDDNGYCVYRCLQLSGSTWTEGASVNFYTNTSASSDVTTGYDNNGNLCVAIACSRYNTDYGQVQIYTVSGTTLTYVSSQTLASNRFYNLGSNPAIKIYWSTFNARTISSQDVAGSFWVLGSQAGINWWDSSTTCFQSVYFTGTDWTVSSGGSGYTSSGIQYWWENNNQMDMCFNTKADKPYAYIATRQYGRSGVWGIAKIYPTSDTSMAYNDGGWTANSDSADKNVGITCNFSTYAASDDDTYGRIIVAVADNDGNVCMESFQDSSSGSTTYGQVATNSNKTAIQSGLGSNMNAITSFIDTEANKIVLAYGYESGTTRRIYYGLVDIGTTTSTVFNNPSQFTEYFDAWYEDGNSWTIVAFAKGEEVNNQRLLNNFFYGSHGTNKGTIRPMGVQRNNYADSFIGVAQATVTSGNPVNVQVIGSRDTKQSGLTAGLRVVVNKTTGALGTVKAIGSNEKEVGVALSSTDFLIK